eukprot:10786259-Karenia_brevis.AAC.1
MVVTPLNEQSGWWKWKVDIEDLMECSVPGIIFWLNKVQSQQEEVEKRDIGNEVMWSRGDRLYRFLRSKTEGDARKIVEA